MKDVYVLCFNVGMYEDEVSYTIPIRTSDINVFKQKFDEERNKALERNEILMHMYRALCRHPKAPKEYNDMTNDQLLRKIEELRGPHPNPNVFWVEDNGFNVLFTDQMAAIDVYTLEEWVEKNVPSRENLSPFI